MSYELEVCLYCKRKGYKEYRNLSNRDCPNRPWYIKILHAIQDTIDLIF